ncbi:hypothetical protein XENOCAPTIV_026252 [Xenoophorus captivus]|uniref:Cilia- and flagella-associated protein 61 N-terminal domain-containing protein n=1 Tax=Xenoophorus captivus TaxID=1517983 RepID=A0ABV0S4N5_9TELE
MAGRENPVEPALEEIFEPLQCVTDTRPPCSAFICSREDHCERLHVRRASVADYDDIMLIVQQQNLKTSVSLQPYGLIEIIENPSYHAAVFEDDGRIVGFVAVTFDLHVEDLEENFDLSEFDGFYKEQQLKGADPGGEEEREVTQASMRSNCFCTEHFVADKDYQTRSTDCIPYLFQLFPAFVAQVDGQVVGIMIIRDEQVNVSGSLDCNRVHHGYEEHAHIRHFVLKPCFYHVTKNWFKEVLRLAHKSCLYHRIYPPLLREQLPEPSPRTSLSASKLMLVNLFLSFNTLTLSLLLLLSDVLRAPSGVHPELFGPGPASAADHLPAGGAWHQRPVPANHKGPGGPSSSWVTAYSCQQLNMSLTASWM